VGDGFRFALGVHGEDAASPAQLVVEVLDLGAQLAKLGLKGENPANPRQVDSFRRQPLHLTQELNVAL